MGNSLELVSKELKSFLAKYRTQNILGHLSFLITCISNGKAQDQLGRLTSPMRQLYYLAGLVVSQQANGTNDIQFSEEDWQHIVDLLIQVENGYSLLFMPETPDSMTEEWKKQVMIAMPSFLSYFNLGPLNYEEQVIQQIRGVYSSMDDVIIRKTGVSTEEYLQFYENIDSWCQYNLQSLGTGSKGFPLRDNWMDYTNIKVETIDDAPEDIKRLNRERQPMMVLLADPGIKYRFKMEDLVTNGLNVDKVKTILSFLSLERKDSDFLYYTSSNPLLSSPIIKLENGHYQVFEEKRVLHSILFFLENVCKDSDSSISRLSHYKGEYLENSIARLFKKFFGERVEIIQKYYVDGCEQDILVLWKDYMFVIEAKAYNMREPFRNTEKAFTRIKDDFNRCIGVAYTQCKRIEDKMKAGVSFELKDEDGSVIRVINPSDYDGNDYYIIVNQESFGQIQVDLSTFLELDDDDNYPWAVRYDDLEVFILTMIAKKKTPDYLVDFLIMREYLHGHIVCSDEGEICGGFLTGAITQERAESPDIIVCTPDLASVFDEQYVKGMGFKNEKNWKEKHDGKTLFW